MILINTTSSNGIQSFFSEDLYMTMFSQSEEKPSILMQCEFNEFYMNQYTNQFTLTFIAINSMKNVYT